LDWNQERSVEEAGCLKFFLLNPRLDIWVENVGCKHETANKEHENLEPKVVDKQLNISLKAKLVPNYIRVTGCLWQLPILYSNLFKLFSPWMQFDFLEIFYKFRYCIWLIENDKPNSVIFPLIQFRLFFFYLTLQYSQLIHFLC
jgi:hypothetical protein